MRAFNVTSEFEAGPLSSRPLLLINEDRQIDWGVTGSGASPAGRYCWEVFGCASSSDEKCKAVRCPTPTPDTRPYIKAAPNGRYPSDVCLISSIQLPFRGKLVWGPQDRKSSLTRIDLHVVASLAGAIFSKDVINGGEAVLDLIRMATGADTCKLSLTDLYGKRLVLTAFVGSERSTTAQRQRFLSAVSFADLAFTQRRPVTSQGLSAQFLRAELTDIGVRSFISVPIPAPDGRVLGCLDLGWQDCAVDVAGIADALWSAATPLGNAICAAYWTLANKVVRASSYNNAQPFRFIFERLHELVGADAGSLVMWDEPTRKVRSIDTFGASPPICPWMNAPETAPCSSRETESSFRLIALTKPHDGWPDACKKLRFNGPTVCCVPVMGQASRSGRAIIGFGDSASKSPARLLVPLQVMIEQIGLHRPEKIAEIPSAHRPTVPHLRINCFGHFEIEIDGARLPSSTFQRRDAITLLKILVLRAGKQVHRTKIIEWLWPDVPERVAMNRLHVVVHALRAAIEPRAAERRWKYVLNERETYTFCATDGSSVDLIEFQKCLNLARSEQREAYFTPNVAKYLEKAVSLYRADLYEEDQYSEWCDVERTALRRDLVDALASLAQSYLTLGDAKQAIQTFRRALLLDPSRESMHQELIRCLIRLKRYQEAKEQVRDCVRHLREDLGVAPSSETQTLYHSLVNMKSGGSLQARRE